MKKKLLLLIMTMMLSCLAVACGGNETTNDDGTSTNDYEEENNISDEADDVEVEEEDTTAPTNQPASNADLQDGKWVNFDKMQVEISGYVVTLGETTLQELVDAGAPFNENDLASIGNNIQPNYKSQGYKIVLGEYWSAQVYVGNYTDENAAAKDLPIVEVYLPNHPDETQDIIKFAFPTTLTEEELFANCGEPQEKRLSDPEDEYGANYYDYTQESTKYYSDLKYSFDFVKGQLKYFTMTYLP